MVAQLNSHMPYTIGDGELPLDCIDFAIEVDELLATLPAAIPDETELQIGERIAHFASHGTTLQFGIGQIPTEAAWRMTYLRGLRVWSEVVSDGVLALERSGALHAAGSYAVIALRSWHDKSDASTVLLNHVVDPRARQELTESSGRLGRWRDKGNS